MVMDKLKKAIISSVERQRDELIELSLAIHSNPELGFKEIKASGLLCGYLEKNGFQVVRGIAGISTAFKACYGKGHPVIALLAEYDALPEVGHACGHNIIGSQAAGAAIACKDVVDSYGGTVIVFGTPAEELYGGKVTMVRERVFDGLDVAMIAHPGSRNMATVEALACINLEVEFIGKAAHAAAHPEQGINALEAMILSFNAINSLRQHIKEKARIHGIITRGGDIVNVVPAYTSAMFLVRSHEKAYLEELKIKVIDCFKGAAIATGSSLEYRWDSIVYDPMNNNLSLAALFAVNLISIGRPVERFESQSGFGSTDMGNVSQVVAAIHASIAIAPQGVSTHSDEFGKAAASESGHQGLMDGAKALAMTVVDLIVEPANLAKVKAEFARNRS
jgi:amidohydrolase